LVGRPRPFETDTSENNFRVGHLPATTLPVRCSPLEGELFSSWLIRLAWLNAEKLHTFSRRFWFSPGSPWGRNIDLVFPEDALDEIANISLISREVLVAHMLRRYSGTLYQYIDQQGAAHGILVGRHRGQRLLGFGVQLCPECIQTDPTPYFRQWWRVAYMVCCPIHRCLLIDACPCCNEPISYHMSDFGKAMLSERIPTAFCANCGHFWGEGAEKGCEPPTDGFIDWQLQLLEALETGWLKGGPMGHLYALSFFQGLRTLIRLLAANGHCEKLRGIVAKELGVLPLGFAHSSNQNLFSGSRLGNRSHLLRYVFWLLEEWPDRFIWAIKAAGIAYSYIDNYRNSSPLAYWLASVAVHARDYRHAKISELERKSIEEYLESHHLNVNANQVNRLLGRWYVH